MDEKDVTTWASELVQVLLREDLIADHAIETHRDVEGVIYNALHDLSRGKHPAREFAAYTA